MAIAGYEGRLSRKRPVNYFTTFISITLVSRIKYFNQCVLQLIVITNFIHIILNTITEIIQSLDAKGKNGVSQEGNNHCNKYIYIYRQATKKGEREKKRRNEMCLY